MELHALSEVETISRKHLNPLLTRRSHVTMCGERVNAITDMPVSRALEGRTQYLPAYETLLWIELHFTCHLVQIHDLPVVGRVVVTVCLLGGQHWIAIWRIRMMNARMFAAPLIDYYYCI
jgi:hypothetical protein